MVLNINPVNGRFICTPELPMPNGAKGSWEHTNAHETDWDSDYSMEYQCDDCGHRWLVEMPD